MTHAHPPPIRCLPSLPELWALAKAMFDKAAAFATTPRREFLAWLAPVEHMVRLLIIAEALTRLLMSPRRPPGRAPEQAASAESSLIPIPGWNTIARLWRAPDASESRLRTRALQPAFHVLGYRFAEFASFRPISQPNARPRVIDPFADPLPEQLDENSALEQRPAQRAVLSLSDRMKALARVIADPEPTIRRIAGHFARFPRAVMQARAARFTRTRTWRQGDFAFLQAFDQFHKAAVVFERLEPG